MGRSGIPGPQSLADRSRQTSAARKRRAAGLEIVERDGYFHIHGTVVVKRKSRRVRRSTGLPARSENRDAAHEIRRQIEAEIRDELVYGIHPSVPLAQAVEAFLKRPRKRPLNGGDADRLAEIKAKFGNRKLSAIADSQWVDWIDQRQDGNAPVTRERYIDLIMAFLTWCKARPRHWLAELPAIERNKEARQRPQRRARRVGDLRPELIARLVNNAPPHLRGMVAIMWSTGARVSSILYGCRLCDYNAAPEREQITFHDTKNGLRVNAAVHPWAASVMTDYLEWRGRLHDREALLFLTDRRQPYKPKRHGGGQIKTAWRAMVDAAGRELRQEALTEAKALRRRGAGAEARMRWLTARTDLELLAQITPHWFRHLLATDMQDRVIDGMEQGGWLDFRSFKGYSHDVPTRRRAAVNNRAAPGASLTTLPAADRKA